MCPKVINFDLIELRFWGNSSLSLFITLLFIWIASILDYFLTLPQILSGVKELNPILAPFFHSRQFVLAFIIKMGLTFVGILILSLLYKSPLVKKATYLICVVYSCLLVYHALNLSLLVG